MAKKKTRKNKRPAQGERLYQLRIAAGLSQKELAQVIGVPQPNITFWEHCEKPPRSDVLPAMAKVLGVKVENLIVDPSLSQDVISRRSGPKGFMQKAFEEAGRLPRRQQIKIVEFVTAFVRQYEQNNQIQE